MRASHEMGLLVLKIAHLGRFELRAVGLIRYKKGNRYRAATIHESHFQIIANSINERVELSNHNLPVRESSVFALVLPTSTVNREVRTISNAHTRRYFACVIGN